jgi:hypothetical protein
MMRTGLAEKLLTICTDAEIIRFAASEGYTLSEADCAEMRKTPLYKLPAETLEEALEDFLNAYER